MAYEANLIVQATYNTTPATRTNGQVSGLEQDTQGDLKVYIASAQAGEDLSFTQNSILGVTRVANPSLIQANYSPSFATNSYLTTSVTKNFAKASAGVLCSFSVTNANAAVRYLSFFNLAVAPTAGSSTPVAGLVFLVPAGTAAAPGALIIDRSYFNDNGAYFSTGIAWSISPTVNFASDTATAADHILNVNYV